MSKRVIYSAFDNERGIIIDHLRVKYGWEPVLISASENMREWAGQHYPEAVFQEVMSARQAQFDYSRIGDPVPIDARLIEALSKFELSCFNLLEDTTGWNFSFYERRRYYYDLLKYWNTVIRRMKPEIYMNITLPHSVTDYTLYLLCKYVYEIPTIFFNPLPLFDSDYYTVFTSLEDCSAPYQDIYESEGSCDLDPRIEEYLENLRSKNRQIPEYIKGDYKRFKKFDHFQYKEFFKLILLAFLGKAFKSPNLAFKQNQKPFETPGSKMNRFQYFWFKERMRRNNRKLRKIYNKFCSEPDFEGKYVYFPAPYQPEAVTCPGAGVYEDIFLVLDILSASVPDGWTIYYKEHPSTFLGFLMGSLSRDRHFYEKVAAYKNVKMVSSDTDTFKLMDHCQAVATAVGTAGWEAAVGGKPVLFFGDAWYQGCKSLFKIVTCRDCIDAVEKIKKGFVPDQADIDKYVAAIQQASVKDMIHYNFHLNIKKVADPGYEMERIADAFYEAYTKHYDGERLKDECKSSEENVLGKDLSEVRNA